MFLVGVASWAIASIRIAAAGDNPNAMAAVVAFMNLRRDTGLRRYRSYINVLLYFGCETAKRNAYFAIAVNYPQSFTNVKQGIERGGY